MNSGVACQAWLRYSTVTRALWASVLYCLKYLGCHGNCHSWYSAVLIIFMVNYKVLLLVKLCQMLLIELDFCESYEA